MATQYLSRLKNRLSNYARQRYLRSEYISIHPSELLILLTMLDNDAEEKIDSKNRIKIGSKVTLFDIQTKETVTFVLVNPLDSNPERGHISCLSPLGRQLMGCMPGDIVEVRIFYRTEMFRVVRIDHQSNGG